MLATARANSRMSPHILAFLEADDKVRANSHQPWAPLTIPVCSLSPAHGEPAHQP